jgi:hypothetical protein
VFAAGIVSMVCGCDLLFPLVEDAGPPPGTAFACGPSLSCSLSNPNVGCCVLTNVDAGKAPGSYHYECVTGAQCAKDDGLDAANHVEIHCDNGAQCPTAGQVCCWPSTPVPTTTYCFPMSDVNCANELCDPDAATPCIGVRHVGFECVPASSVVGLGLAPLGYNVCVPPDAG